MPELKTALMNAALAGAFTAGAAFMMRAAKFPPNTTPDKDNLDNFLVGAVGSLLQQYVGPML